MRFSWLCVLAAVTSSCAASDPPGDAPGNAGGAGAGAGTGGTTPSGGSSGTTSGSSGAGVAGSSAGSGTGGTPSAGSGGQPQAGAGTGGSSVGGAAGSSAGTGPAGSGGTAGSAGAGGAGGAAGVAGTTDAGGSAGSGGSSGMSGSGGSGGSTGSLGCTGSELLCEDFEDVADGMVPAGGPWKPLDASCEFQMSSFSMGVTSELANGGSKSLKVTNKHFAQCRLSGQFTASDDFWIRSYSYWETGLDITNRETLDIDLTPGFRTADDPAVRFGYRSKSPCEEYAGPQVTIIGLAGGEATGCGSREMPKGRWFCFEAHIQQASTLIVSTYVDGEAISYQSTGKPMTDTIATETAISQKIDHIRLGIFSTGEAQGSIYLDDVAVATTRIGCAE
jgi:hypothetical protein